MPHKKTDIKSIFKDKKLKNIIIVCGILAMILILLSSFSSNDNEESSINNYSVKEYKTEMQDSLQNILTQIEGVGEVEVLLTIESSVEGVYLDNNSTKTKEIEPVIRGVVIACEGGNEPVIKQNVLNAVTKALNISSAKVCITKLKE